MLKTVKVILTSCNDLVNLMTEFLSDPFYSLFIYIKFELIIRN